MKAVFSSARLSLPIKVLFMILLFLQIDVEKALSEDMYLLCELDRSREKSINIISEKVVKTLKFSKEKDACISDKIRISRKTENKITVKFSDGQSYRTKRTYEKEGNRFQVTGTSEFLDTNEKWNIQDICVSQGSTLAEARPFFTWISDKELCLFSKGIKSSIPDCSNKHSGTQNHTEFNRVPFQAVAVEIALERGIKCFDDGSFTLLQVAESSATQSKNKRVSRLPEVKELQANDNSKKTSTIPNANCAKLASKMATHIEKEDYDKAMAAQKLMDSLNCSSTEKIAANNSNYRKTEYSKSQLSCEIGPLAKNIFREFGRYHAKSFDVNPQKDCISAYNVCKAKSKALSESAEVYIPKREKRKSYSASCRTTPIGSLAATNCNVYEDSNSGGFTAGVAEGLSDVLRESTAKRKVYLSNFKICMADMGYSLTEK